MGVGTEGSGGGVGEGAWGEEADAGREKSDAMDRPYACDTLSELVTVLTPDDQNGVIG